jgi:hypothetical protein
VTAQDGGAGGREEAGIAAVLSSLIVVVHEA